MSLQHPVDKKRLDDKATVAFCESFLVLKTNKNRFVADPYNDRLDFKDSKASYWGSFSDDVPLTVLVMAIAALYSLGEI